MLSRIQSLGSCLIVLTLLLFAGSAAAQDVSPRCEAAMEHPAFLDNSSPSIGLRLGM